MKNIKKILTVTGLWIQIITWSYVLSIVIINSALEGKLFANNGWFSVISILVSIVLFFFGFKIYIDNRERDSFYPQKPPSESSNPIRQPNATDTTKLNILIDSAVKELVEIETNESFTYKKAQDLIINLQGYYQDDKFYPQNSSEADGTFESVLKLTESESFYELLYKIFFTLKSVPISGAGIKMCEGNCCTSIIKELIRGSEYSKDSSFSSIYMKEKLNLSTKEKSTLFSNLHFLYKYTDKDESILIKLRDVE